MPPSHFMCFATLLLRSPQIVGIKNRESPDWWMAALENGLEGWVPANYLEMQ